MEIIYNPQTSIEVPIYKSGEMFGYTVMDNIDFVRLCGSPILAHYSSKNSNHLKLNVTVNTIQWTLSHFISGKPPQGFVKDH